MDYFDNVNEFFEKGTKGYFLDPLKKVNLFSFLNGLENSIFYLVSKILEEDDILVDKKSKFIKVPMRELGAEKYSENYASFCGAIAQAAGLNVYNRNKVLGKKIINVQGDLTYINKTICKIINENIARPYNFGYRNYDVGNAEYQLNDAKPKLLTANDFSYTKTSGKLIENYFSWVKEFNDKPSIFNSLENKVLIISHSEIDDSKPIKFIPHCRIDDNGEKHYSSPVEPLIYLARDISDGLIELVKAKFFDTVIFVGDNKFRTGGIWSNYNDYFKKSIYIGFRKQEGTFDYYSFSPPEIYRFYGINPNDIIFEHVEFTFKNELLDAFKKFIEKVNEINENGGNFKFSLYSLLNRTAPINDVLKEKMLEWFEQYLIDNLNYDNDLDYENLTELFANILVQLKDGNEAKIDCVNKILKGGIYNKNSLFFIVSQKDEIGIFSKILKLNEQQFIVLNSFNRRLKVIVNSNFFKNIYSNQFIFLSYGKSYHEILRMMDSFSILGKRIFVGGTSIKTITNEREKFFNELLADKSREKITSINYEVQNIIIENVSTTSLDDFEYDDENEFIYQRDAKIDNFRIKLENGESIVLNGTVVKELDIVDIEELKIGDEFTYYQSKQELFDETWRIYEPDLAEIIEEFNQIWIQTLKDLKVKYNDNEDKLYEELRKHNWKTEQTTLRNYLREANLTQFPRVGSLKAIKKLCETLEGFREHTYVKKYDGIRKSQKALSRKVKLGRIVVKALFEQKVGNDITEPFIIKLQESELFNKLVKECLKTEKVAEINKIS